MSGASHTLTTRETPEAYAQRRANETRHPYVVAYGPDGAPLGAFTDCVLNRRVHTDDGVTFRVFRPVRR